jgi:DNA-binding NarL/FixJ family response regulator
MVIAIEDTQSIICMLKAGANGCMLKTDSPDKMRCAIIEVCEGGAPLSSPIARKVVNYFNQIGSSLTKSATLSIRQREIMGLLTQGFTYKEIGNQLEIGTETVRTHVKNVCRRMHVNNRMEAVAQYS